jgi:hypothetical protein
VERKQCVDCGESNLESECHCWACGGIRFAADDVKLAGEPTICLGTAREATVSWDRPRSAPTPQTYVLVGTACALFACVMGYWIGRASAPVAPPPVAATTSMIPPQMLPTPPTGLSSPQSLMAPPAYFNDPAVVTVRQKSNAPRGTSRPTPQVANATEPTAPIVLHNPSLRPRQRPQVTQATPASRPAAFPAEAENPIQITPLPSPGAAVVMLRNDAAGAVEVSIDGDEDWTVTVAAGGSVPVTLSPGSYQLRAEGAGARSKRSTLAISANRNYSLIISRKEEGGRESLVLVEPAVDGVGS